MVGRIHTDGRAKVLRRLRELARAEGGVALGLSKVLKVAWDGHDEGGRGTHTGGQRCRQRRRHRKQRSVGGGGGWGALRPLQRDRWRAMIPASDAHCCQARDRCEFRMSPGPFTFSSSADIVASPNNLVDVWDCSTEPRAVELPPAGAFQKRPARSAGAEAERNGRTLRAPLRARIALRNRPQVQQRSPPPCKCSCRLLPGSQAGPICSAGKYKAPAALPLAPPPLLAAVAAAATAACSLLPAHLSILFACRI